MFWILLRREQSNPSAAQRAELSSEVIQRRIQLSAHSFVMSDIIFQYYKVYTRYTRRTFQFLLGIRVLHWTLLCVRLHLFIDTEYISRDSNESAVVTVSACYYKNKTVSRYELFQGLSHYIFIQFIRLPEINVFLIGVLNKHKNIPLYRIQNEKSFSPMNFWVFRVI